MSVSIQAVNVMNFAGMGGLKSTQERQERQQKCDSQVNFFEKQKEKLKDMKCSSLEDIARKLEMFHTYEDQIAAAKKQFNNSQMSHVLDEAQEIGEKIAEEAEKMAPKTPEERKDEKIEEATGKDEESKGLLSEIMDEMAEMAEELQDEMEEQLQEGMTEAEAATNLAEGMEEAQNATNLAEGMKEAQDATNLTESMDKAGAMENPKQQELTITELAAERLEERLYGTASGITAQNALQQARIFQTEQMLQYQHIDYRL
ncbi:MAG: hypothetical protein K2N87_07075 [Eubacterium sp.]|nr:hypothetical protein [Eubacterium sp.]